jgi:hypothetical protein
MDMILNFITDLTIKDISLGGNVLLIILLSSSTVAHFIHRRELKWRFKRKSKNQTY